MKLTQITEQLNEKLNFPYMKIVEQHSFTDNIYIVVALDTPDKWVNGYLENTKYIKAMIFCDSDREGENSKYELSVLSNTTKIRVMQKKKLTGEKVLEHTIKQLSKLIS